MAAGRLFRVAALTAMLLTMGLPESAAHAPHDVIKLIELSPDYRNDQTLFVYLCCTEGAFHVLLRSTDGGRSFKALQWGLDNKRPLSSIQISPDFTSDRTVFVASVDGEVFKSIDGGQSWRHADSGLPRVTIRALAISPRYSQNSTVLAATPRGLYRTNTGGSDWIRVSGRDWSITSLTFVGGRDEFVIGTSGGALFRSEGAGGEWERVTEMEEAGSITTLAIRWQAGSSSTWFVGTEHSGLLVSNDGGTTFQAARLGNDDVKPISSVALSPFGDCTVFAASWHWAPYRSTDCGQSWQSEAEGVQIETQADEFKRARFEAIRATTGPDEQATLFLAAFAGLLKSVDGGKSWLPLETLSVRAVEGLVLSPGFADDASLAIATFDGGDYQSADQGASWTLVRQGMWETHLWDLSASASEIYAISNSAFYKKTWSGQTWNRQELDTTNPIKQVIARLKQALEQFRRDDIKPHYYPWMTFPLQIIVSPDHDADRTIFLRTRRQGVLRSSDSGESWSQIWGAERAWLTSLALSPQYSVDRTVFAGVRKLGIYRSEDAGKTWWLVNRGLEKVIDKLRPQRRHSARGVSRLRPGPDGVCRNQRRALSKCRRRRGVEESGGGVGPSSQLRESNHYLA